MDFREFLKIEYYESPMAEHVKNIQQLVDSGNVFFKNHEYFNWDLSDLRVRKANKIVFANGLRFSILTGVNAFCTPRKNLEINEYTEMELAILGTEFGSFVGMDNEYYSDFKLKNELASHFDGSVYTYVPIDLIQEVFEFSVNKFGLDEIMAR